MSSLGSAGSGGGAAYWSAAPTLSTPKPVSGCQPGWSWSTADSRTAWLTWSAVSSGRAARTQATAADTIGAAKLVPLWRSQPSWTPSPSRAGGTAVMIASPGAERSIAALVFEKNELRNSGGRPTAATVRTCGSDAGYSSGLPSANSLPAAATGTIPLATATWSATYSGKHRPARPVAHVDDGGPQLDRHGDLLGSSACT